jgi:hypothetical protein
MYLGGYMRRNIARNLTVLIAVLALAFGTMAAPAFAGAGFGGGPQKILDYLGTHPDATCAYFVDSLTGHTFLGIRTGRTGVVRFVGPFDSTADANDLPVALPNGIGGCGDASQP